jgi:hypothetical protein
VTLLLGSDVGLNQKDKIIAKRFGNKPFSFYICTMNNLSAYIGALTASWTIMNSKSNKNFKPSKESILILLCTMGFLLGLIIGMNIVSYFILK